MAKRKRVVKQDDFSEEVYKQLFECGLKAFFDYMHKAAFVDTTEWPEGAYLG